MKIKNKRIRKCLNRLGEALWNSKWVFPVLPEDNKIMFFARDRADFPFLSNFYTCEIEIDGQLWPHTEAYYQSQKSENPRYHKRILEKEKPSWSKHIGDSRIGHPKLHKRSWFRKHPEDLRLDWNERKVDVMKIALQAKFTQNKELQQALLNTYPAELIEDSKRDTFWGCGKDGSGNNMLGKLLMEQRASLMHDNF